MSGGDTPKNQPLFEQDENSGFNRVLKAVLVADAAGFSRLLPEDPEGTIHSLNRHRVRMREIVAANGGLVAGLPGDFLLALFNTSSDALDAAVKFLKPIGYHPGQVALNFRVGLHVGDVYEQSGDYLGVAINIASRLQVSAPVGGMVMSQTFRDSLPGKPRYPLHKIGDLDLKNIDEPIGAYEMQIGGARPSAETPVEKDQTPVGTRSPGKPHGIAHAKPTILVTPFRSTGGTTRAAVFADGLCEELITTLSVFSDVFRSIDGLNEDDDSATYEIRGQVRNGDRLRITCHLIDRKDGQAIWSDRFDFGNDASYDAQERITMAVITALQIKLTEGESAQIWSNRNTSLAAWEQFHLGRMSEARYTSESNRSAREHFSAALNIDPEFVPAIVAIGFSHLDSIRLGWTDDENKSLNQALRNAKLARKLDRTNPYATALMAYVERARGNLDKSLQTMAKSIQAAPRNGELLAYFANMLWMHGERDNAIKQYRRALKIIPQPASWVYTNLGLALISDQKIDEALRIFSSVVESDPDFLRAHIGMVVAQVRKNRMTEAKASYQSILSIDPNFSPENWIAQSQFSDQSDTARFVADLTAAR